MARAGDGSELLMLTSNRPWVGVLPVAAHRRLEQVEVSAHVAGWRESTSVLSEVLNLKPLAVLREPLPEEEFASMQEPLL